MLFKYKHIRGFTKEKLSEELLQITEFSKAGF